MIVIHEIFGLTDWEPTVADRLAKEGYVAIVPDLLSSKYGQSPTDPDSGRKLVGELEPERITADLDATYAYVNALPAVREGPHRHDRLLLGRRPELPLRHQQPEPPRGRGLLRPAARHPPPCAASRRRCSASTARTTSGSTPRCRRWSRRCSRTGKTFNHEVYPGHRPRLPQAGAPGHPTARRSSAPGSGFSSSTAPGSGSEARRGVIPSRWAALIAGSARALARACSGLALALRSSPASAAAQSAEPGAQTPLHYNITLVTSDTSGHLLGEVETGWRLRTVEPVAMRLDSVLRVVRVLVDGKPNTRLSRTMYARQGGDVIVPHEKAPGDTLTTRVRYHGVPRGGFRVGPDQSGARALAGTTGGGVGTLWLPMPPGGPSRVAVAWNVQASDGQRVVANGALTGVDTLSYGHTTWHYRLDTPVPLDGLAVAAGRYAVTTLPHSACPNACVSVTVWTSPADSAAAVASFQHAGDMVDFMTRRLGPFPYPSLAHVSSLLAAAGRPGAMVVLYDQAQVRGARSPKAMWPAPPPRSGWAMP